MATSCHRVTTAAELTAKLGSEIMTILSERVDHLKELYSRLPPAVKALARWLPFIHSIPPSSGN